MTQTPKTADKDLVARLTGAGEEAVQRLGELPMGKALLDTAQSFRERLDEARHADPGHRPAREARDGARAAARGARGEAEARTPPAKPKPPPKPDA